MRVEKGAQESCLSDVHLGVLSPRVSSVVAFQLSIVLFLSCISAACLWLHWILAFLCQLNPLMGPILKKEHAETVIFAWESIDE